jgi:hypothetical protein
MASSSSQNKPETINLNDTPSVMPEVWRPYFLSINGPVSVTDSVILNGETATAVAAGLCTPEDAKVLAGRTDPQIINESLALTVQCTATVSNINGLMYKMLSFLSLISLVCLIVSLKVSIIINWLINPRTFM